MKIQSQFLFGLAAVLALATGPAALAQPHGQDEFNGLYEFSGLINDYSPATVSPAGPWELRGDWSLQLKGQSGKADFTADLNMVRSDYWVVLNPSRVNDDSAPNGRYPHTHHVFMTNATVALATSTCSGVQVSGPVTIRVNGGVAPFDANGPSSLTVCVTGGTYIPFSNVALTFGGSAAGHFGTQPVHGIIREVSGR
jgi:hypothetical protein